MATVTGGGVTTYINVGSNDANGTAQALANTVTTGLGNGTLFRTTGTNPPTGAGVVVISTPNVTVADNDAVKVALINANGNAAAGTASVALVGSGGPNQVVIGDNSNIIYNTRAGGGQYVFGDGNDVFGTNTVGGGNNHVTMGGGADTVNIYSGNATVQTGSGSTTVNTGAPGTFSNVLLFAYGNVNVVGVGGLGTDTVIGGNGTSFINDGTKSVFFNGQGGTGSATIIGGTASDTVYLGSGGGQAGGGSAGNNLLFGGTGSAGSTLFGGGNGDVLFARGSGQTVLIAGPGNETLQGGASTGNNIYIAGLGGSLGGNTTIGGGSGSEVYYLGAPTSASMAGGNVVVDAGTGADIFSFTNRSSGSTESVVLNGFSTANNDKIQLIGFGSNNASTQASITSAAASAGSVTLTDGTKITFGTAVTLNSNNFA